MVHDREDLFEDDFEFDDDFEEVGDFEDDFYEDADDDADDDDDDDVLWEEADDSDAPSRRSSAAKTPGKRGKADAPRSDSAAKHKNAGKAEPKPPRGKGAKNSKPAGGKKQSAKSGADSGAGKERAGDAAERSGSAAPKPRHEAAARGDSDAKSRPEGAKTDRKEERREPEKKGRASGPKQTPATTRPGGGDDAGPAGPASFAAELYAADDELLDNEVDETTEEEVARPTGPQADHLVHIYEFGQLKRTIPRKFTDEQAVSFAEEYTRTGKPYGRLAVAMPDDEQPAQSFADAARG